MNILLLTPPLTQLNTPYPATTVLKGYLQQHGHTVHQGDLGIELVHRIFTPQFLMQMFRQSTQSYTTLTGHKKLPPSLQHIHNQQQSYIHCITPVMQYLRGQDDTLSTRIATRRYLPEGPRFHSLKDTDWDFGTAGTHNLAQYIATLFILDLTDYIRLTTAPYFDLVRYAESLSDYAPTFDAIEAALQQPPNLVDIEMLSLIEAHLSHTPYRMVGFCIPFPGCLYGALRCAQYLRQKHPDVTVCFGGGFPNTEWRQLSDPRLFQYCHYVTLDDGEIPLLRIADGAPLQHLVRTYYMADGHVHYSGHDTENIPYTQSATPDFTDLPLHLYLSLADTTNPMQRLWSAHRWNKMMVAHGCYWARCAFCDTSLDYIKRYSPLPATTVVDRMEHIIHQTGCSGFHFVDEALPPQILKDLCHEILRRHLTVTFWGNIRFEKSYDAELCHLLSQAGCIAVSGGLEVASDRLLSLMHKGVTLQQTLQVMHHLHHAGIMVHAYLMYGFPGETLQESVNALEVVRYFFAHDLVQSAFWHRFAMTCHSPIGQHPHQYGVERTTLEPHPFCNNEVDFYPIGTSPKTDSFPYDIDAVGEALRIATYNYMRGAGLDMPLRRWFSIPIPKPQPPHFKHKTS